LVCGFPKTAATVGLASEVARRGAPQLLLSPTGAGWLASLPRATTVAAPWASFGLRAAAQAGTAEVWPPPVAAP
jgi:hypothetical protein